MTRIILILTLIFFSPLTMALSYTIEISEAELQNKVSAMMPIKKEKYSVNVTLSNPKIELLEGSDEIGVFSHLDVMMPKGIKGSGSAKITGSIEYKPKTGAFFLKKPVIKSLDIHQLSQTQSVTLRMIAQLVINKVLEKNPVYKLKDDDLKQKLAKSLLRSVSVKNKTLLIELGM